MDSIYKKLSSFIGKNDTDKTEFTKVDLGKYQLTKNFYKNVKIIWKGGGFWSNRNKNSLFHCIENYKANYKKYPAYIALVFSKESYEIIKTYEKDEPILSALLSSRYKKKYNFRLVIDIFNGDDFDINLNRNLNRNQYIAVICDKKVPLNYKITMDTNENISNKSSENTLKTTTERTLENVNSLQINKQANLYKNNEMPHKAEVNEPIAKHYDNSPRNKKSSNEYTQPHFLPKKKPHHEYTQVHFLPEKNPHHKFILKPHHEFILTHRLFTKPQKDNNYQVWLGKGKILHDNTISKMNIQITSEKISISPQSDLFDAQTAIKLEGFSNKVNDIHDQHLCLTNAIEAYDKLTSVYFFDIAFHPFKDLFNDRADYYLFSLDTGNHQRFNNLKDYFIIGRNENNDIHDTDLHDAALDIDTSRYHAIFNKENRCLINISFHAPLFIYNAKKTTYKETVVEPLAQNYLCNDCLDIIESITSIKESNIQEKEIDKLLLILNHCKQCDWDSYCVTLQSGDIIVIGNYQLLYRSYIKQNN